MTSITAMSFNNVPPPIEESGVSSAKPYFVEYLGRIINVAEATEFYVDHFPLLSSTLSETYWPCAKVGGRAYQLADPMSKEKAMNFIKDLTKKIADGARS